MTYDPIAQVFNYSPFKHRVDSYIDPELESHVWYCVYMIKYEKNVTIVIHMYSVPVPGSYILYHVMAYVMANISNMYLVIINSAPTVSHV